KQIFEYFESSNESLIIGIHGSWGSGKSTLLSFIKDEISMRKPGCISFEFNPWMFSGKEELHKMFLKEFGIELGSKRQKIREVVKTFANLLTWTENIDGGWKSIIGLFKKLSETTVVQLKKEIDSLLIKEKVQSVIFLDDIDRLTPVEMLEIFQLIRLNANFSNTVFIISFDKEVVSTAIENQYSLDGEKYLEKIIQVDYSLPDILPERIESLFFETLNSMLAKYEIEFKTSELNYPWAYKGLQNFFKNVRDINRFFNAIKFRLPAIHGNIDIHDFLIIEAIRIFDHESYVLIKTFYKDSVKFGSDSHAKEELSRINNGRSVSLYALLFENNYRKKRTSQYEISNAQFFDRYFSLSISSKDVREEDFQHYLNLEKDGTDYLGILIETGRIEFLLRRLSVVELYS
ncbi:MAG: P-loop NTPase fold protein, partial [Bacteroidota bacterium]